MTPEQKAAHDALIIELKSQIETLIGEKSAPKAELVALKAQIVALEEKSKTAVPADYADLKAEHVTLMAEVKALGEKGRVIEMKSLSVKDQIKDFMVKNADKFAQFKKGEIKALEIELQLKAAGTMLESTNLGSSAYLPTREIVPGYNDLVRTQPLIEQYANTSGTSSANIVWVNKKNADGTVAMVDEGGLKPLLDFDFGTETSVAKKAAGKIKVSTEMLEDIDFMAAAIEGELRYQVDSIVDAGLLTGVGTTIYLTGITTLAGGFVLTTLVTTNPSDADAILAAATQIKSLEFNATHAFINPIDAANMKLTKDDNGQYVIPPFQASNGLSIGGVVIVESNKISQGSVLVADMSKFIVRNYKPFHISYGWTGNDFEYNLVTILGERRLHSYASENNTGAFVYDTFANIKTAIAPAP